MSTRKRILSILLWSVISAAFIGPGTVTTAASSGASYGSALLWALVFSTLACIILQEAAARISIVRGKNLGQSINDYFENSSSRTLVLILVAGAIITGTAAYEMGNLIGAVEGIKLLTDIPSFILVLVIGLVAAVILSIPSLRLVSTILGVLVVFMGLGFLITAIMVKPDLREILRGSFIPSFPGEDSGTLVLALIGTTIVPYNLFLGSGLSKKGQSLREMRFGLFIAIILGGIFSMAVLIAGSAIAGDFTFEAMAGVLDKRMGLAGKYLFGSGLFAAGFTSAVTAPLAAAVTLSGLYGQNKPELWKPGRLRYRLVWIIVLFTGVFFASLNIKPVPAIILAQALNGFLLPFVSVFLYLVLRKTAGQKSLMGTISGVLMLGVIYITLIIGLNSALKAILKVTGGGTQVGISAQLVIAGISLIIVLSVGLMAGNKSKNKKSID